MPSPATKKTSAPVRSNSRWWVEWLSLTAVLAAALLIRVRIAAVPLERDEGEYAYIAQRWLDGEVPYKDSFDQKPPGVFVAYLVIFKIFGTSPAAIHWGAQIYSLGTLAILYALSRRLFGTGAGFVAALLAALLTADKGVLGNAANTETFMLLPLTAGLWTTLLAVERDEARWAFVTGVCGGAAVLFKQQAALSFLFCLGYVLWISPRRALLAGAMVLGGLILAMPVIGYFAATGALAPFYDCVIGYNLSYTQQVPLERYPEFFWSHFVVILKVAWPAYLLGAVGAGLGAFDWRAAAEPAERRHTRMLLGWLALSFAGVSVSGTFRQHYFLQLIPGICLLAGRGAQVVAGCFRSGRVRQTLPYGLAAGGVILGILGAPGYYLFHTPDQIARTLYSTNPFPEARDVSRFIAERTAPNDTVFVFGSEPEIYYYAHRPCASRYIFLYPVFTNFSDTTERQESVLAELRKRPPRFIVFLNPKQVPGSFLPAKGAPISKFYDEFTRMLRDSYEVVAIVPHTQDKDPRKAKFPLLAGDVLTRLGPLSFDVLILQVWQWRRAPNP